LNKYNRKKGTYGNGDGKDASHKGGKISGFEKESVNRGRKEKSRLKKEQKLREVIRNIVRESLPNKLGDKFKKLKNEPDSEAGEDFAKHHAGSLGAGDMGQLAEPDTYDWDDKEKGDGEEGGHQIDKDVEDRGYEPVREQKLIEMIRKIVREDFAGSYPAHKREKFDNKRRKQSEVLGYKLTGVNDVKTEIDDATVKESVYTLPRGSNTQDLDELDADLIRAGLKDKEVTPDFNKLSVKIDKTILKGSRVGVKVNKIIKKYKLKQTEGNVGISTKKGKTIELTHKTSGKEIVVRNSRSILKKYAKMGYLISMPEGKLNEASETPVEVARRIVQNGQYEKYKGMMLDAFTASAIVKVYDAVNDSNKQKMDKLKLPKLVNIVWKLIGRS
jgi:hypothetical protein